MDVMDDASHRLRYSQDKPMNVLAFIHDDHRRSNMFKYFLYTKEKKVY